MEIFSRKLMFTVSGILICFPHFFIQKWKIIKGRIMSNVKMMDKSNQLRGYLSQQVWEIDFIYSIELVFRYYQTKHSKYLVRLSRKTADCDILAIHHNDRYLAINCEVLLRDVITYVGLWWGQWPDVTFSIQNRCTRYRLCSTHGALRGN